MNLLKHSALISDPILSPLSDLSAVKLIELKSHNESNGSLIPITSQKEIPISIARIFYVLGVNAGETRGDHAHIRCSQVLICPMGKCEISCTDGKTEQTYLLGNGRQALYVPPTIWMRQTYILSESMLMVLADRPYEEEDYIRKYSSFLRFRDISTRQPVIKGLQ